MMSNNTLENCIFPAQSISANNQQLKEVKISTQHLPFTKTSEGCCAPAEVPASWKYLRAGD